MSEIKVLYHFNGFLADRKMKDGKLVSTSDGCAFYAWSIIRAMQRRGWSVICVHPNRDKEYVAFAEGAPAFATFATDDRYSAYKDLEWVPEAGDMPEVDALLLEWRWPIPGRNTEADYGSPGFQPDLLIQEHLLAWYKGKKPMVAMDLDYKMTPEDDNRVSGVMDFGFKRGETGHTDFPFDTKYLESFPIEQEFDRSVVYIGNRYERDWAIDKYLHWDIKRAGIDIKVYGNWLESGRESDNIWPHISFHPRAQLADFPSIYRTAGIVPLLAKEEYCRLGFMTPRILEAVMFGALPVLIGEFDSPIDYQIPVVNSPEDIIEAIRYLKESPDKRIEAIRRARRHLTFMSADSFVRKFEAMIS